MDATVVVSVAHVNIVVVHVNVFVALLFVFVLLQLLYLFTQHFDHGAQLADVIDDVFLIITPKSWRLDFSTFVNHWIMNCLRGYHVWKLKHGEGFCKACYALNKCKGCCCFCDI